MGGRASAEGVLSGGSYRGGAAINEGGRTQRSESRRVEQYRARKPSGRADGGTFSFPETDVANK